MTPSAEKLYKKALVKLSASDATPRALYEWLLEKVPDADHEEAKNAVRQLALDGFVNEERSYAQLLFEGEKKLWGEAKFREELSKRRFGNRFVKRFAEEEIDFAARALTLAHRLCPAGALTDAEKRSLFNRLAAKGHGYENARSAVRAVSDGKNDDFQGER